MSDDLLKDMSDDDLATAGLIATQKIIGSSLAPEAQFARSMYHAGIQEIMANRVKIFAAEGITLPTNPTVEEIDNALKSLPRAKREAIGRTISNMRHDLAMRVRESNSALVKTYSELRDAVRGKARDRYDALKAGSKGRPPKTDAQIIKSATKSDEFTNKLPKRLKWLGRGFLLAAGAYSIYLVIDATPEMRDRVIEEEINTWLGATGGGLAAEVICASLGLSSGGVYILILFAAGVVGAWVGSEINLARIFDITPHIVPELIGNLYYIEGNWEVVDLLIISINLKTVSRGDRLIVLSTGRKSGLLIGGIGHFHNIEVIAASKNANKLFKDYKYDNYMTWVPDYLLHPVQEEDLLATCEK
jgi:hypothetical protein